MSSAPADGAIAPTAPPFRTLRLPVTATIGGVPAPVTYSGSAPGYLEGFLQINIQVPQEAPSGGALPLVITLGGVSSPSSVTVFVR